MYVDKIFIKSATRLAFAVMALLVAFGCEPSKKDGDFKLKNPIPTPAPEPEVPPLPDVPPPDVPEQPPQKDEGDKAPVFLQALPSELSVLEGAELRLLVAASDPEGGAVTYFYQCPYACPDGMSISLVGEVRWTPGYFQSGVYDVRFTAVDAVGEATTSSPVRVTVVNVNRSPKIDSVTIVPDKPASPSLLVCVVAKTDRDGDDMTTTRVWKVNGLPDPALVGQTISADAVRARDSVVCEATVVDSNGAAAGPAESEAYVVPNTPPALVGLSIVVAATGSALFRVGDAVECRYAASDADGDAITASKISILSMPDGREVAASTSGNLSYEIRTSEGHKNLACRVEITDGYETVSTTSPAVGVVNSAPRFTSIQLFPDGGAPTVSSGEKARCEAIFSDPDGDVIIPQVTFYNAGVSRGPGVDAGTSGIAARRTYALRTVYDVTNPLNADVRGNQVVCGVVITDVYGASGSGESAPLLVKDSPPSLDVSPSGGGLSQSLGTGFSLLAVDLVGRDNDGEIVEYVKETDSCAARDVNVRADSGGRITSDPVPTPVGPQIDRDCSASFYARSGGKETARVTLAVAIKNHAPILYCSNTEQVLATGAETFRREMTSPGDAMTTGICTLYDEDDALGENSAYDFSLSPDGCGLAGDPTTGNATTPDGDIIRNTYKINGKMKLDACATTVTVSDGSLSSNGKVYALSPIIDFSVAPAFDFDSGCYVTIYPDPGKPTFSGGYAYSSSSMTSNLSGSDKLITPYVSASSAGGRLARSDLEIASSPFTIDWKINGLRDGTTASGRTVQRQFAIAPRDTDAPSIESPRISAAFRPISVLGQDASEGRQASLSRSCVRTDVSCSGSRRASISAGDEHVCVVNGAGAVYCWGGNGRRQLGATIGAGFANSAVPVYAGSTDGVQDVDWSGDPAQMVAAGAFFTCAVTDGAKVRCWGDNRFGQVGNGQIDALGVGTPSYVQTSAGGDLSGIVAVSLGDKHACALASDGAVWCWGSNALGQLGEGSVDAAEACSGVPCRKKAVRVADLPFAGAAASVGVAAGGDATCVVLGDGRALCFGDGGNLQLGGGNASKRYGVYFEPSGDGKGNDDIACDAAEKAGNACALSLVNSLNNVWSMSLSTENSCALSRGGRVDCWGLGALGQLGNGLPADFSEPRCSNPAKACFNHRQAYSGGSGDEAALVAPGVGFMCGVSSERRAECFGGNDRGQLGADSLANQSSSAATVRTAASELDGVVAIAAGKTFACAISENEQGGLHLTRCWGDGSKGQLADGSLTNHFSRVALDVSVPGGSAARICEEIFKLVPVLN